MWYVWLQYNINIYIYYYYFFFTLYSIEFVIGLCHVIDQCFLTFSLNLSNYFSNILFDECLSTSIRVAVCFNFNHWGLAFWWKDVWNNLPGTHTPSQTHTWMFLVQAWFWYIFSQTSNTKWDQLVPRLPCLQPCGLEPLVGRLEAWRKPAKCWCFWRSRILSRDVLIILRACFIPI